MLMAPSSSMTSIVELAGELETSCCVGLHVGGCSCPVTPAALSDSSVRLASLCAELPFRELSGDCVREVVRVAAGDEW